MLTDYECSQIQRAYEREIREIKRILSSYDAAMQESRSEAQIQCIQEDFTSESVKLKKKERELKNFCNNGDKQEFYEDVYSKITNTCHTEE